MIEVTEQLSWKVREKRAKLRITATKAAKEIGISFETLAGVESGEKTKVKRTVYEKIVNWLFSS